MRGSTLWYNGNFRNHGGRTYGDNWEYIMWSGFMYMLQSDNCLYLLTRLNSSSHLKPHELAGPSRSCRTVVIPPSMGRSDLVAGLRYTYQLSGCRRREGSITHSHLSICIPRFQQRPPRGV